MDYEFPTLDDIGPVLAAIRDREEFSNHAKGEGGREYAVLDYHVSLPDTFPDWRKAPDAAAGALALLRREARGLIYDPESGEILSRAFHKFFNLGERDETAPHQVDLGRSNVLLDKLDGSMVRPFVTRGGHMRWGTMAGLTPVAAQAATFIGESARPYERFSRDLIEDGWSPIFEWCSRQQRIVLDYPVDGLVLTGVRHRRLGTYVPYDRMRDMAATAGIPVVPLLDLAPAGARDLMEHARQLVGAEGYVVRFADGHMLKVKGTWYLRIHKVKERLELEKDAIELILSNAMDDVLPDLPPADRDRVLAFAGALQAHILIVSREIEERVATAKAAGLSKKDFAGQVVGTPLAPLLFAVWDGRRARETLVKRVLDSTSSGTRVEGVRHLIGVRWETYGGVGS